MAEKDGVICSSATPTEWEATSRIVKSHASFKWKIENFSQYPSKGHDEIQSPSFSCCSSSWGLSLYPNGSNDSNEGNIGLFLHKRSPNAEKKVKYQMCFKDEKGVNHHVKNAEAVFVSAKLGWNCFISREILLQEKCSELLPEDVLTVYCEISVYENTAHGEAERSYQRISNESTRVCPLEVMSNDFSALRKNERNCDVKFYVGDEEFSAHKLILKARSPVFAAMFQHDMQEARDNVVSITDVEPSIFDALLDYVYSGSVSQITAKNARKLYLAADKYDLEVLRQKCMRTLLKCVSVEGFCGLVMLADMHNDEEMMDSLKDFARQNVFALIHTKKWDNLLQENPHLATEIFRAATKKLKPKENGADSVQ